MRSDFENKDIFPDVHQDNGPKCHQGSGGWSEGGGELTTGIAFSPPVKFGIVRVQTQGTHSKYHNFVKTWNLELIFGSF